jgi:hypothetical protein
MRCVGVHIVTSAEAKVTLALLCVLHTVSTFFQTQA